MRISDWSSDVCSSDLPASASWSGQTKTLMQGLHFANGVAVGPGASYLLVSETNEYRIWRYWLKGVRAGQQEIFADNLPGFPDNLSIDDEIGRASCRARVCQYV